MTMRTVYHFICSNGHEGSERISENDQPYSKSWESITLEGMHDGPKDAKGKQTFLCDKCSQPMLSRPKPTAS